MTLIQCSSLTMSLNLTVYYFETLWLQDKLYFYSRENFRSEILIVILNKGVCFPLMRNCKQPRKNFFILENLFLVCNFLYYSEKR